VADHVHVLFVMSRTVKPSDVIKEIKRSSTLWLKERCPEMWGFAWQRGYGLFSIGFSQMRTVCAYIARQEEHHRRRTFQEEFRQLLQRYAIDYDERYVWD
jgi:REP element-mobilizing transposase RayT